ncbi:MAG TPA: response regulator [Candidatus Dormibacteraeota bacterium]|nr:response regulator [Candidatus Dormibacteraeota bacterium]
MTLGTRSGIRQREIVLIADDEPGLRLLVRSAIESPLYQVVEASDGDEAWNLIKSKRPAVVLLDITMSGRSGLEVLSAIRADTSLRGTQVIILSGGRDQRDIDAGLLAGADVYVTKPFAPADLLARVTEAIEHRVTW